MLLFFLSALGWAIAHAPERLLRPLAAAAGECLYLFHPGRRRMVLSNLDHAFPGKGARWYRQMGRRCFRRLIETGLLSLATPHLDPDRIRRIARLAPSVDAWARERQTSPRPVVFGTLHLALWETQTWLKLLSPVPLPEFGIIFRPLDNTAADHYVQKTRERFGMRLLSRKEGFADALRILRQGGCIGVLFDQNAGMQGALTLLFGRVCSSTELPGLLAGKFDAELRTFYPRRTGFWRVEFRSDPVEHDATPGGVAIALNRWLEAALTSDQDLCASWLWGHNRWRHQDRPTLRFRLESRRNLLDLDLKTRGLSALPRRTRIWVRMPNWLGDAVMALALLRALRVSRPDAEITLWARPAFLPLLRPFPGADAVCPLPPKGLGYFPHFWRARRRYPDVWVALTHSARGDIEGWLTGAPQRFGIVRAGRRRPLLTHAYAPPSDRPVDNVHQLDLWHAFFRHFGLEAPLDKSPFEGERAAKSPAPIGLIAGSENNPSKRWPVPAWRALIELLPEHRFVLFGTSGDRPITRQIAAGHSPARVEDLAGQTDLEEYLRRLRGCRLVVANDTGGMHLANALGVPLIALFGPTNPVRTGPVYSASRVILQPPGCPATGGRSLDRLTPASVAAAVHSLLPG